MSFASSMQSGPSKDLVKINPPIRMVHVGCANQLAAHQSRTMRFAFILGCYFLPNSKPMDAIRAQNRTQFAQNGILLFDRTFLEFFQT